MTEVVNVKVSSLRPQYNHLADWMRNPNNVYIGRPGVVFINGIRFPKERSIWANPFYIKFSTRADVLEKYEMWIRKTLNDKPELKNELLKLDGKKLGCWCWPERCHGDILKKLLRN